MRTNRPLFFFFSVFCALICTFVWGGVLGTARPASAKDAPAGKNVPGKNVPGNNAPTNISGVSTGFTAALPDPKRPGKHLYDLHAALLNGSLVNGQINGSLTTVWARLYQNGVPAAVLTAPHAFGKSAGKSVTVTGTGGVAVKSLTEPGTTLSADKMVWHVSQNLLVATGHVVYHNGKNGATLAGPYMTADTRLKKISISGGGHGTTML